MLACSSSPDICDFVLYIVASIKNVHMKSGVDFFTPCTTFKRCFVGAFLTITVALFMNSVNPKDVREELRKPLSISNSKTFLVSVNLIRYFIIGSLSSFGSWNISYPRIFCFISNLDLLISQTREIPHCSTQITVVVVGPQRHHRIFKK